MIHINLIPLSGTIYTEEEFRALGKVLKKYPEKMPKIFSNMFKTSSNTIIKFLSNKSNIFEDIVIISKMPKLIFLRALFD